MTAGTAGTAVAVAAVLAAGARVTGWFTGAGSAAGGLIAQVIANGWTAAPGAALVPLAPATGWAVLAGGLAAAQADTWATEIGIRAPRPPVLLTTGAPVPPGTSGGVTPAGTAAGLLGAAALGGAAGVVARDTGLALAATAAGVVGMLADSVLGATVQAAYRCVVCDAAVEGSRHRGVAARRLGGRPWITNDLVNALAAALAAW